jgi:hypothetical protein
MTEVSEAFRLCELMGSCLSILGEPRRSIALFGDAALKAAETGVGRGPLGDRRASMALTGVADVSGEGVMSCDLLALGLSFGPGDPLLSMEGDLGGTSGRSSNPSRTLGPVSNLSAGLLPGVPGLRIGESGLPSRVFIVSVFGTSRPGDDDMAAWLSVCRYDGPVTQETIASPNGPTLQLVPGALLDRSWPKVVSDVALRSGGLPGMVGESMAVSWTVAMVPFVPPSSGTLILRRLASELPRCQNGTASGLAAVSLSEVGERPIERAVSLSEDSVGRTRPIGLLDADDGQSWYRDGTACCCKLNSEGLFSSCGRGGSLTAGDLEAWSGGI